MKITFEPMLAMFGLGGMEIILILAALFWCFIFFGGIIALIVWLVKRPDKKNPDGKKTVHETIPPTQPTPPVPPTEIIRSPCPQCGTPLSSGALVGLCPVCLLKTGAATETITDAKQPPFVPPLMAELAAKFPQLEILELIGKGGMGAVYKARQKQLDRIVALKILPPDIGSDPAFAERFTREAKALAKLNHPNIVTLYEFGEASGQFYFLMEFVDGVNLRQLLQNRPVSAREALAIVPQICDALQFAHDQGIVHRDIKPENILLDRRGRVKVADFGLAKIVAAVCDRRDFNEEENRRSQTAATANLTDAGKVMGTPNYMSPEQLQNPTEVDHRADIYALGVVFYQMLTGELPGKRLEAPSKKVQIDVRLDEIVLRALEKKPELRYQQASALKTQIETMAAGDLKSEARSQESEVEPRFSRPAIVGAGLIAILALIDIPSLTTGWPMAISRKVSMFLGPASLGLSLIFAGIATNLGWIAVSKIRRSEGKIYGLWLAVFDGLLFPLLALDGLIVVAVVLALWGAGLGWKRTFPPTVPLTYLLFVTVLLGILLLVDWLIIRRVWHAVNQPPDAPPQIQKPDRFWRWFAVIVLAMIAIPIVITVLGLLAAIAIPNFVKVRQIALANRQTEALKVSADSSLNFFIGQTYFPQGDSIEITSVDRTAEHMIVKGHYNLISTNQASLSLNFTSTHNVLTADPMDATQTIHISKGQGDFELSRTHLIPGLPHVSMYGNHQAFAGIYFGTKAEARESSQLNLTEEEISTPAAQLTQVGWELWQAHKLDEAGAKFDQAVNLAPDDANAWNGLGWTRFNAGDTRAAEFAFQKVLLLEPYYPAAFNGLGQIYLSQGNYDAAEKYLLKAAPRAPASWFGLARLYLLQGKFADAQTWAQKIVNSGQGDQTAKQMLEAAKNKKLNDELRAILEPQPPANNLSFVAKLPQGTIELLAVATTSSHHPDTNLVQTWWHPNGTLTTNLGFELGGSGGIGDIREKDLIYRKIVLRSKGIPVDASEMQIEASEPSSAVEWGDAYLDKHPAANTMVGYLQLPDKAKTLHLKIGIAAGPWTREEPLGIPQSDAGSTVQFVENRNHWQACIQSIEEINGSTKVIGFHTDVGGWQSQLVLVDKTGKEWPLSGNGHTIDGLCQLTAKCDGLKFSQVKEIHFRIRPFQSVEFNNVSLQPMQQTQVEIIDSQSK